MRISHFRADVRLVKSAGASGLERHGRVLWFDDALAEYVWDHGPGALGSEVQDRLESFGFASSDKAHSDRSRSFLEALVGNADRGSHLRDWEVRVLGCGGLGSGVAIQLASLGIGRLVLVDPDLIEPSNLNRLSWAGTFSVGLPKVRCLASYLGERFETAVVARQESAGAFLSSASTKPQVLYLLAMDDNLATRAAARALSRREASPYLQCGYLGTLCAAGPLVTGPAEACPFCNGSRLVVQHGGPSAPSAMPNNLFLASFVASQICLFALTDSRTLTNQRWLSDLRTGSQHYVGLAKNSICEVCS